MSWELARRYVFYIFCCGKKNMIVLSNDIIPYLYVSPLLLTIFVFLPLKITTLSYLVA